MIITIVRLEIDTRLSAFLPRTLAPGWMHIMHRTLTQKAPLLVFVPQYRRQMACCQN